MHSITPMLRGMLLVAVALADPACLLDPEIVGETLTGDAATGLATVTDSGQGASETSAGPVEGAYGSFCEHVGVESAIVRTEISAQPLCDGGVCLVVNDDGPLACDDDPECADVGAGSICSDNGLCTLSTAFIEANQRCTQTCEADGDCPAIAGCETGVRCATITLIGELCCQRVCACNDRLYAAQESSARALCDADPDPCA